MASRNAFVQAFCHELRDLRESANPVLQHEQRQPPVVPQRYRTTQQQTGVQQGLQTTSSSAQEQAPVHLSTSITRPEYTSPFASLLQRYGHLSPQQQQHQEQPQQQQSPSRAGSPDLANSMGRLRLQQQHQPAQHDVQLQAPQQLQAGSPGIAQQIAQQLVHLAQPPPMPVPAAGQSPAAGAAAAGPAHEDTPAANAERHRLSSTAHTLDLQTIAKWVEGMLPYILILAAVFVYHYCTGIFLFLWLLCSLIKANQLMRKVVAQKRDYQRSEVIAALLYIATNVGVVGWLTAGQRLYRSFLLQPPSPPITAWQAAFLVIVADSLVRFCGLAPKLLVVMAVQSCSVGAGTGGASASSSNRSVRRQARLLTLLEYLISAYRALVPIPVWYTYLLTCTLNNVLCSLLAGFYLTFKGYGLLQQGQLLLVAAKLVLRTGALHGRYLGKGEAHDACCPICQDPAVAPVALDCSHVYCEECISEWLERDRSCPMCRSSIQPPGLQSFGDGATSLLPNLF